MLLKMVLLLEGLTTAALAMLVRAVLKRLTMLPFSVLDNASVESSNLGIITAGATTICGAFFYLTRNQHQKWRNSVKKVSSIKNYGRVYHNLVNSSIKKAITKVKRSSRKLQRNAMLFITSQIENLNPTNTQNTNTSIPTNSNFHGEIDNFSLNNNRTAENGSIVVPTSSCCTNQTTSVEINRNVDTIIISNVFRLNDNNMLSAIHAQTWVNSEMSDTLPETDNFLLNNTSTTTQNSTSSVVPLTNDNMLPATRAEGSESKSSF